MTEEELCAFVMFVTQGCVACLATMPVRSRKGQHWEPDDILPLMHMVAPGLALGWLRNVDNAQTEGIRQWREASAALEEASPGAREKMRELVELKGALSGQAPGNLTLQ